MISRRDLEGAIRECENAPVSYQNCEKLATFYTLWNHAYDGETKRNNAIEELGDSDFLRAIKGNDPAEMWGIMDELMGTLLITNPRLYDGVMRKISGQL